MTKLDLQDLDYTHLDQDQTAQLIMSTVRLMDSVFNTRNKDFETYAQENPDLVHDDPLELFDRCFDAIKGNTFTKYQTQFQNFAQVNTATVFKWFRKNRGSTNLSPKQLEWFKRWFAKHNIGHEFLLELDPSYDRSIKPNFKGTDHDL